jgi:sulfite reductase beta subunit-like hemoprotein
VHEIGAEKMRQEVEAEYAEIKDGALKLPVETIEAIARQFAPPALPHRPAMVGAVEALKLEDGDFALWLKSNVSAHRLAGYRIVTRLAEARRRAAGRCQLGADGRCGRYRRRLQPGRDPGEP